MGFIGEHLAVLPNSAYTWRLIPCRGGYAFRAVAREGNPGRAHLSINPDNGATSLQGCDDWETFFIENVNGGVALRHYWGGYLNLSGLLPSKSSERYVIKLQFA